MKLNETIDMMVSSDYKERFKGEYFQLIIRMEGLRSMLKNTVKEHLILLQAVVVNYFKGNLILWNYINYILKNVQKLKI
jgi:hypothetical protein